MKKLLLFTTTILVTTIVNAQIVTEFVKGLTNPKGLAVDNNNQLYIGEAYNSGNEIYKIDKDGTKSLFFKNDFFNNYILFDSEGNLITTNGLKENTVKISSDGTMVEPFTRKFDGNFVIDKQNNIFYSVFESGYKIRKVTPEGLDSVFIEGFEIIDYFALDSKDNLYVVDFLSPAITKIGPDGKVKGELLDITFPSKVAIDQNGNIYFDERFATNGVKDIDMIVKYNFETKIKEVYAQEGITAAVEQIVLDKNNVMYVSCDNNIIYKIEPKSLSTTDYEGRENSAFVTPNPTSGIITLENNIKSLDIYDLQGKLVYQNTKVIEEAIDISNLTIGVYSVHLTDHNNQKSFTKLVKN